MRRLNMFMKRIIACVLAISICSLNVTPIMATGSFNTGNVTTSNNEFVEAKLPLRFVYTEIANDQFISKQMDNGLNSIIDKNQHVYVNIKEFKNAVKNCVTYSTFDDCVTMSVYNRTVYFTEECVILERMDGIFKYETEAGLRIYDEEYYVPLYWIFELLEFRYCIANTSENESILCVAEPAMTTMDVLCDMMTNDYLFDYTKNFGLEKDNLDDLITSATLAQTIKSLISLDWRAWYETATVLFDHDIKYTDMGYGEDQLVLIVQSNDKQLNAAYENNDKDLYFYIFDTVSMIYEEEPISVKQAWYDDTLENVAEFFGTNRTEFTEELVSCKNIDMNTNTISTLMSAGSFVASNVLDYYFLLEKYKQNDDTALEAATLFVNTLGTTDSVKFQNEDVIAGLQNEIITLSSNRNAWALYEHVNNYATQNVADIAGMLVAPIAAYRMVTQGAFLLIKLIAPLNNGLEATEAMVQSWYANVYQLDAYNEFTKSDITRNNINANIYSNTNIGNVTDSETAMNNERLLAYNYLKSAIIMRELALSACQLMEGIDTVRPQVEKDIKIMNDMLYVLSIDVESISYEEIKEVNDNYDDSKIYELCLIKVVGSVVEKDTDEPIKNAAITFTDDNGAEYTSEADEDGSYEIYIKVGSEYEAEAKASGFSKETKELTKEEMFEPVIFELDSLGYYEYIQQELIPIYGLSNLDTKTVTFSSGTMDSYTNWNSRDGILSAHIEDFNKDDTEDMLLYTCEENGISVTIYTKDNKGSIYEVCRNKIDSVYIEENILNIGVLHLNDKVYLYVENNTSGIPHLQSMYYHADYYLFTDDLKLEKSYRMEIPGGSYGCLYLIEYGITEDKELLWAGSGWREISNEKVTTDLETPISDAMRIGFSKLGMPEANQTIDMAISTGENCPWYTGDETIVDVDIRLNTEATKLGLSQSWKFTSTVEELTDLRKMLEQLNNNTNEEKNNNPTLSVGDAKDLVIKYFDSQKTGTGTYNIFDSETVERDGKFTFSVRYACSDEEAQEMIKNGKTPAANTLTADVTVDPKTWDAEVSYYMGMTVEVSLKDYE